MFCNYLALIEKYCFKEESIILLILLKLIETMDNIIIAWNKRSLNIFLLL